MVVSCSAINCTNRRSKGLKFHRFPLKNPELCKQWVVVMKRDGFTPTRYSFLCEKHFKSNDYTFGDSWHLKENAIPTVFDFPSHLKKTLPERKPPMKRKLTEKDQGENEQSTSVEINKSSTEVLKFQVEEQRKKIKVLQQKIRRKEKNISRID